MSSLLVTVWTDIQTLWEALTPPSDARLTYQRSEKDVGLEAEGLSKHRRFSFVPVRLRDTHDYCTAAANVEHEFRIQMSLVVNQLGRRQAEEAAANEAVLLARAINSQSSWSAGIDFVRVDEVAISPAGDSWVLTFSCRAWVRETD